MGRQARTKVIVLLAGAIVPWNSVGCTPLEGANMAQKHAEDNASSRLEIAPLIRLDKSTDMIIKWEIRNTSGTELRYFRGSPAEPVAGLYIVLSKDGQEIPALETNEGAYFSRDNLLSLGPGERLRSSVSLRDYGIGEQFDNLPVGRYEVRAEYSMPKHATGVTEMGATPIEINELIAIIELTDSGARVGASGGCPDGCKGAAVIIVIISLGVLAHVWRRRMHIARTIGSVSPFVASDCTRHGRGVLTSAPITVSEASVCWQCSRDE